MLCIQLGCCDNQVEYMCRGVCLQSELCGVLPPIPGSTVDLWYVLQ